MTEGESNSIVSETKKLYSTDYIDREIVYGSLSIIPLFALFLIVIGIYQIIKISNFAAFIIGTAFLLPTILIISIEITIRKRLKIYDELKNSNRLSELISYLKKRFGWKNASESIADIIDEKEYPKLESFLELEQSMRKKARVAYTFGLIGTKAKDYTKILHNLLEKIRPFSKEEFLIAYSLASIEGKESKGLELLEKRYGEGFMSDYQKNQLFYLYQSLNAIEINIRLNEIQDITETTDQNTQQELQSNDFRFLISKIGELTKTNLELTKNNTDLKRSPKEWVRFLFEIFLIGLSALLTWLFTTVIPNLSS